MVCEMKKILLVLSLLLLMLPTAYSKVLYSSHYEGQFQDDTDLFEFLFSKATNRTKIVLEPKTYTINSLKHKQSVVYDDAFIKIVKKKRITVEGNGAIIVDRADKKRIANNLYSFIKFESCSRVSINGITYRWLYEATLDPKVEGIIFIRTIDECKRFDIDVSVINAGRGVYSGLFECKHNPGKGLYNSRVKVNAQKVGYSIAIERGDKLEISNNFDICHRGERPSVRTLISC